MAITHSFVSAIADGADAGGNVDWSGKRLPKGKKRKYPARWSEVENLEALAKELAAVSVPITEAPDRLFEFNEDDAIIQALILTKMMH